MPLTDLKVHTIVGARPQFVKVVPIEPVGYLDMLVLEQHAKAIFTNSGGVQKEAYLLAVACITLRAETEWVETVEAGWSLVVDTDSAQIPHAALEFRPQGRPPPLIGDGHAAEQIVALLRNERT